MQGKAGMTGHVVLRRYRHGRLYYVSREIPNATTTRGLRLIRDLLFGAEDRDPIRYIALGDSSVAFSMSQSSLGNEIYRSQITATSAVSGEDGKRQASLFVPAGELEGEDVMEAGLFDSESGGIMFSRIVLPAADQIEDMPAGESISFTWTRGFEDI